MIKAFPRISLLTIDDQTSLPTRSTENTQISKDSLELSLVSHYFATRQ